MSGWVMYTRWVAALAVAALGLGCGGAENCGSGELSDALAASSAGATVALGECTVEGRIEVPAGVVLAGAGADRSVIRSNGLAVVLGDGATIQGVRVEHGTGHGIFAADVGAVTIRDVAVQSVLGRAAIGLSNVDAVIIQRAQITGPVTAENAGELREPPTESDTTLFGVVLVGVTSATLTDVQVVGFGAGGVVSSESTLTMTGGLVAANLGLGVWINAGSATLADFRIENTLRGFRGTPSFGLVTGNDADIDTTGLEVARTEGGFGIFHDGGTTTHMGLLSEEHDAGGVLAQRTVSLLIGGTSIVRDNDFGGILAVEAGGLTVEDTVVANTLLARRMFMDWGAVDIGDGIQLVRPTAGTVLQNLELMGNARAGFLGELGGASSEGVSFTNVTIDAAGTALGAVMQNGTTVPGWDSGITRAGDAIANDAAFSTPIDTVRIVGPADSPIPAALVGIVGPAD